MTDSQTEMMMRIVCIMSSALHDSKKDYKPCHTYTPTRRPRPWVCIESEMILGSKISSSSPIFYCRRYRKGKIWNTGPFERTQFQWGLIQRETRSIKRLNTIHPQPMQVPRRIAPYTVATVTTSPDILIWGGEVWGRVRTVSGSRKKQPQKMFGQTNTFM